MRIFGQDRTRAAALSVSIEIDEADQAFEVEQKLKNNKLLPGRVTQWNILGQGQKLGKHLVNHAESVDGIIIRE